MSVGNGAENKSLYIAIKSLLEVLFRWRYFIVIVVVTVANKRAVLTAQIFLPHFRYWIRVLNRPWHSEERLEESLWKFLMSQMNIKQTAY